MKLQLSFAGLTYPVSNLRKKVHPLPLWRRGFWLIRDHFAFNHPFVTSRSGMNPFSYWSSSSGFFDKWTARVRRTLANKVIAQGVSSFMEENSGHVSICCLCKKSSTIFCYNQIMVIGSYHFILPTIHSISANQSDANPGLFSTCFRQGRTDGVG